MKTSNNTLVTNTMSSKDHLILERACDRTSLVQITRKASVVDGMIGAKARCPNEKVDEATSVQPSRICLNMAPFLFSTSLSSES